MSLEPNLSQFYATKAMVEEILGHASFMEIKESASLTAWKRQTTRLMDAAACSIQATVQVVDREWESEVADIIDHGKVLVSRSENIDDVMSGLAATMSRLVFQLIGFVPRRHGVRSTVSLRSSNWRLDQVRSIQYVQTPAQRARAEELRSHRERRPGK